METIVLKFEDILENKKVDIFAKLLLEYNKIHNISGVKNLKDAKENVYDSVYPLKYLTSYPKTAIDIGSGAGFPAIALALFLEKCEFTLFEPIAKKSAFLHLIKNELTLSHVNIQTNRIEKSNKQVVDLITSRAVGDTNMLIELSNGFYDKDTTFLLYKGEKVEREIFGLENVKIFEREKRKYLFIKGIENVT